MRAPSTHKKIFLIRSQSFSHAFLMHFLAELASLAKHGICLPPNMQGLTDEQVTELNLKDEWQDKCTASGGVIECKDPVGKRAGSAPNAKMADVINRTREEAKSQVSKVIFFILWFIL